MLFKSSAFAAFAAIFAFSAAHEVESIPLVERSVNHAYAKRSLAKCSDKLYRRDIAERRVQKRRAFIDAFETGENKNKREAEDSVLNKFTVRDNMDEIDRTFKGEIQCMLAPEVTIGPYYLDDSLVRDDITEDQEGVTVYLDLQFINTETCEPVTDAIVDIWHCNATGIYSGVSGDNTVGETFLRGLGETDEDGLLFMKTIYPGWYVSRSVHVHVASHMNATIAANDTISGGHVNHIGQLFFPDGVTDEVAETYPYTIDYQERTYNGDDSVLASENATGYDAVMTVEYLGTDITEGLIAYVSIGVNKSANYDSAALVADSS